jgi:RimJ/RimL family protein N-acetyltransferase
VSGLETPRLRLRPLGPTDAGFYRTLYTDAALLRDIAPALDDAGAARSFAAALRDAAAPAPTRRRWVIVEADTGDEVGLLGLIGAEVGALVIAGRQGRGYAAEAIAALAHHAFADLGIPRLHTRHAPANAAAAGLMRKLGFAALAPEGGQVRWQLECETPTLQERRQSRTGAPACDCD